MRKNVIRGLIKHYLKLEDKHPDKEELKKALVHELSLIIDESEHFITDYLLDGWINNELRTDLEEKLAEDLGLPPYNPDDDEIVFKLPKLKTPEEYKKDRNA